MEKRGDPIWIKDPKELIRQDRLLEFVPKLNMSYSERINAIVRFSIYAGAVLALLHSNYLYLYVPIVVLVMTYFVYTFQSPQIRESYQNQETQEKKKSLLFTRGGNGQEDDSRECYPSSVDNPFMNPLPADDRKRGPACSTTNDAAVANKVEANFGHNLFTDVNDIYNRRHSQRQWYTVPNTTFGEEQGKFAQWLYGVGPTCKEGNGDQCVGNNHTRLNQSSYKFY